MEEANEDQRVVCAKENQIQVNFEEATSNEGNVVEGRRQRVPIEESERNAGERGRELVPIEESE